MNRSRKLIAPLLIVAVAASSTAFAAQILPLFSIENSLTKSKAVYVIQLNDDFQIDTGEPVYSFWLRSSGRTREMTWAERRVAYGIEYQNVSGTSFVEIALSKFSQRKITIEIADGKAVAHIMINGKNCIFQKVFVKASGSALWPTVEYAEIIGIDPDTGAGVTERVNQ